MKNVLIVDLVNSLMPLSQGLLRASYIFKELGEADLFEWCDKEIYGYGDKENVPSYRKYQGVLKADVLSEFNIITNITIPTKQGDDDLVKISTVHNGNSINIIENLINSKDEIISVSVPGNNYWVAQQYVNGNIQNLRILVHKSAFERLVSSVRKELIDNLYSLTKKYGNLNKYDIGKKKMRKNSGNITNNNISFGDNTKINNSQVGNTNNKTEEKSKNFFSNHPVISAVSAALIVAMIVATKYWGNIINFFENIGN